MHSTLSGGAASAYEADVRLDAEGDPEVTSYAESHEAHESYDLAGLEYDLRGPEAAEAYAAVVQRRPCLESRTGKAAARRTARRRPQQARPPTCQGARREQLHREAASRAPAAHRRKRTVRGKLGQWHGEPAGTRPAGAKGGGKRKPGLSAGGWRR